MKFKAWDPTTKSMSFSYEFTELVGRYGKFYFPDGKNHKKKNLIILQFTGLQDKNKVDIYGGDLVRVPDSDFDEPLVVAYKAPQFILHEVNKPENRIAGEWNFPNKVEVIGNVFENKELLNK